MSRATGEIHDDGHSELLVLQTFRALSPDEAVVLESLLASCEQCRRELEELRATAGFFAGWPSGDPLTPPRSIWEKLAERIGGTTAAEGANGAPVPDWVEPDWEEVAPGISVKNLASDYDGNRVSMLVRLDPDTNYPAHTHAGIEELHLLDGELWINERELFPGDYSLAVGGTRDHRVWSPTGCTCLLVTSPKDELHTD